MTLSCGRRPPGAGDAVVQRGALAVLVVRLLIAQLGFQRSLQHLTDRGGG